MSNLKSGEFFIDSLILTNPEQESISLRKICSSVIIFESIYEPFLSGRLTILDGAGILQNFKLTGQESLTINIAAKDGVNDKTLPEFSLNKTFRIYAMTDHQAHQAQNTRSYVLHFTDPKQFICNNKRLSKTLRGSYSNMLLDVLMNDAGFQDQRELKDVADYWEDSEPENLQVVCPNWTISKFISYATQNANKKSNTNSYENSMFFFQTMNGSFRFVSFETMCKDLETPLIFDFNTRQDIDSEDIPIDTPGLGINSKILAFKQPTRFNVLKGFKDGAYAGTQIAYDPVRKIPEENVFRLADCFDSEEQLHVSKHPPIRLKENEVTYSAELSGAPTKVPSYELKEEVVDLAPNDQVDAVINHQVNPTNAFSDEAKLIDAEGKDQITQQLGNEVRNTSSLQRRALKSLLLQNNTYIALPFRTDLTVGTICNLKMPKLQPEGKDEVQDPRYLITKIQYNLNPIDETGVVHLTCAKDSLGVELNAYFPLGDIDGIQTLE
tara:strand:+ start:2023 stop:3510 length:1488 start_codon:yes stop_codon:yes gene_type:complete